MRPPHSILPNRDREGADKASATMELPMDKRRMCPHCRAFITTSDRVCPYCQSQVGPRAIDARHPSDILGGFIPHARFTTSIILLINCGLFAVTLALSMGTASSNALLGIDGPTLYRLGAKFQVFERGEGWRLVTELGLFAVTLALSMGTASSNALLGIDGPTLYRLGAKFQVFERGEWWRLVTAGFLHGGILHILMNSWELFDVEIG